MMDRETQLMKAAFAVFSRYGVSKTTVGDIAAEAGVSRQTMYNLYGGRDEILRAAVEFVAAVRAGSQYSIYLPWKQI